MKENAITQNKYSLRDSLFLLLFLTAFCNDSVLNYIKAVSSRLPVIHYISEYVVAAMFILIVMVCLAAHSFCYTKWQDVIAVMMFISVLMISYLIHPENQQYYSEYNLRNIFLKAIPFFLLGINLRCDEKTMRWLAIAAFVAISINILYMNYLISSRGLREESMGEAYIVLPNVMIALKGAFDFKDKKIKVPSILFAIEGLIFVLAMGSRGPILILFVYFCILTVINGKKNIIGMTFLLLVTVTLIVLICSGSYVDVLIKIRDFLASKSFSTRIVDYMIEGEYISDTSGRDALHETLLQKFRERPLLGYGVFGEWQFVGVYAHNYWLELCMHYGCITGIILVVAYILTLARALFASKNYNVKSLIILFSCLVFVKGFISGSVYNMEVFFTLGLAISEIRKNSNKSRLPL